MCRFGGKKRKTKRHISKMLAQRMFAVLACTVQGFKRFYLFFFYFVSSFSLLLNMSLMWIWQLIRVDFRDEQRPTEVRESGIIKSVLCCRDVVTPRTKLNSALIVEYVFSFCYWGEIHRYLFSTWHIRIMKNNTPACSQHLQLVSLRIGYFITISETIWLRRLSTKNI